MRIFVFQRRACHPWSSHLLRALDWSDYETRLHRLLRRRQRLGLLLRRLRRRLRLQEGARHADPGHLCPGLGAAPRCTLRLESVGRRHAADVSRWRAGRSARLALFDATRDPAAWLAAHESQAREVLAEELGVVIDDDEEEEGEEEEDEEKEKDRARVDSELAKWKSMATAFCSDAACIAWLAAAGC